MLLWLSPQAAAAASAPQWLRSSATPTPAAEVRNATDPEIPTWRSTSSNNDNDDDDGDGGDDDDDDDDHYSPDPDSSNNSSNNSTNNRYHDNDKIWYW